MRGFCGKAKGKIGILSAEQTEMYLRMSGDRNLTIHPYDEEFAVKLSARMKDYGKLLRNWLGKISDAI